MIVEICKCGHVGGTKSDWNRHAEKHAEGHGACEDCDCKQYTWVGNYKRVCLGGYLHRSDNL